MSGSGTLLAEPIVRVAKVVVWLGVAVFFARRVADFLTAPVSGNARHLFNNADIMREIIHGFLGAYQRTQGDIRGELAKLDRITATSHSV